MKMKVKKEEEVKTNEVVEKTTNVGEENLKVFISQPMKDKTIDEILADREIIITKANKILNNPNYIDNIVKEGEITPLECLGKNIEKLASADIAIFAEGYNKARGCKIEHTCCEKYGIPVLHL